jgi:hypothetical protein
MSDRFAVQVRRRTVGIAVRNGGAFRFYASEPPFFALEGRSFLSLRAVILAAERQAEASLDEPAPKFLPSQGEKRRGYAADPPPAAVAALRSPTRMPESEEVPEWFRWAFYFGLAATPALAVAVATAVS